MQEAVTYIDSFGDCRSGCTRHHEGQDLIGQRLFHERAAVDGTVAYMKTTGDGTGGNWLEIRDAQGWSYNYGHINNDTPGTDDGANPAAYRFAPGIVRGAHVKAGQFVAYMGDSGDAETSVPHLHFEIRRPDDTAINAWPSLRLSQGLDAGGGQCRYPSVPTPHPSSASAAGYWTTTATGAVSAFGAAHSYGDFSGRALNQPITGMTARTTGHGYWLLGSDGGIFSFGDAPFYGSTGAMHLNQPDREHGRDTERARLLVARLRRRRLQLRRRRVLRIDRRHAAQPTDHRDGRDRDRQGLLALRVRRRRLQLRRRAFFGSTGGQKLTQPVVRVAVTPASKGYWLVTSDGGVFSFGDGAYYGSLPALGFCAPRAVVSIAASHTGHGYWLLQADGHIRTFGDARSYGDASASPAATVAFALMP